MTVIPIIAANDIVIKKVDADTRTPNPAMDKQNSCRLNGASGGEAKNGKFSVLGSRFGFIGTGSR